MADVPEREPTVVVCVYYECMRTAYITPWSEEQAQILAGVRDKLDTIYYLDEVW